MRNGEPKSDDGRRRNTATRALATERGDRLGVREEERGLLPDFVISSSMSSGVGGPLRVLIAHAGVDVVEQAVGAVVEHLALLPLLHLVDERA